MSEHLGHSGARTISTSAPFPVSAEGRKVIICGSGTSRLYVQLVRGCTLHLVRPSLVDWALGRVFGWYR